MKRKPQFHEKSELVSLLNSRFQELGLGNAKPYNPLIARSCSLAPQSFEALEAPSRQLGIDGSRGDALVPEIALDRSGINAIVGH